MGILDGKAGVVTGSGRGVGRGVGVHLDADSIRTGAIGATPGRRQVVRKGRGSHVLLDSELAGLKLEVALRAPIDVAKRLARLAQ